MASVRFSSSSSMMRPCSMSTSSILPGCSRHFLTILRSGMSSTPTSERHDDEVVVGDDVARRPQAVAVERRADLAAVGERHRRRAVPGLHQRRVVLVERAPVLVHQRVAGPGLGDHQHHRVRERVAAHHAAARARCRTTPSRTGRRRSAARSCRGRRRAPVLAMPCWRARIQLTLPRSVLISPLWQIRRNGCARSQVGNVLVEKRWWTIASADTMLSSAGRGSTRRPGARAACPCRRCVRVDIDGT